MYIHIMHAGMPDHLFLMRQSYSEEKKLAQISVLNRFLIKKIQGCKNEAFHPTKISCKLRKEVIYVLVLISSLKHEKEGMEP